VLLELEPGLAIFRGLADLERRHEAAPSRRDACISAARRPAFAMLR
jgi:hypothetical protein